MYETMQITVNNVIKLKFFLLYLLFFIFPSNFIDSESGVTIRNQLRIRRLDTRRHRARDHSTRHRPLPTYWWSFGTQPLSPAVFEILASKCIGVTTLTFHGHVMSSVTWPFDSQVAISYRHSIVSKCLTPAISEILGPKHIGVTTLTLQGHLTSSFTIHMTIRFAGGHFFYRHSIVTKSLSPSTLWVKKNWATFYGL